MRSSRRRSGSRAAAFVLAVCVLIAGGIVLIVVGLRDDGPSSAAAAPLPARDFSQTSVPDPATGALPRIDPANGLTETAAHAPDTAAGVRSQEPDGPVLDDRLVIPVIGVNAQVMANPIDDGSLVLPEQVNMLTLWDGSADIAGQTGTVLVAGHVDNYIQGEGALYWLHTLEPGDALYLSHRGVVTRWKTVALKSYPKQAFPQEVWAGPAGPRTLVVVTCGGAFHSGNYDDNVVLTAVPF